MTKALLAEYEEMLVSNQALMAANKELKESIKIRISILKEWIESAKEENKEN